MAASSRIVFDSGALSALAKRNDALRHYLARELRAGSDIVIPAVVVAESTTGSARDANVNAIVQTQNVRVVDEIIARAAGRLRFACRALGAGTIDAIVVATADTVPGSIILTSDIDDLRPLAEERGISKAVALQ